MKRTIYATCLKCGAMIADHYSTEEEKQIAAQAVALAVIKHSKICNGGIMYNDLPWIDPDL